MNFKYLNHHTNFNEFTMTKQDLQIEIRDLVFDRLEIDYIDKETVDFDGHWPP